MGYTPPTTKYEIIRHQPTSELVDVMGGADFLEIKIGQHGSVALMDVMPRLVPTGKTCDSAIVQAARTSYGQGTRKINEDVGLIRYLVRHRHTTPLEMVVLKFRQVLPVFVARQWIRHRTASVNEYSARYSVVQDRFYRPDVDDIRAQSLKNRQGSDGAVEVGTAEDFLKWLDEQAAQHAKYEEFVNRGIAREQARMGLPLTMFTEWYWKIDLHNFLHFLSLRLDDHAQKEIRDVAFPMLELVKDLVPAAIAAFLDYHPSMKGMSLSAPELTALNGGEIPTNKRELQEFSGKLFRMGMSNTPLFTRVEDALLVAVAA